MKEKAKDDRLDRGKATVIVDTESDPGSWADHQAFLDMMKRMRDWGSKKAKKENAA